MNDLRALQCDIVRFFCNLKKNSVFLNEKLASEKNALIIRSPKRRKALFCATLAQLVERNLAKVEVTGSNPVCRSSSILKLSFVTLFLHAVKHKLLTKISSQTGRPIYSCFYPICTLTNPDEISVVHAMSNFR